MRRFEQVIDLGLLDRLQHDEAIRVRFVADEIAYAIRMFVEPDLGHAHNRQGAYVVGHFKMVPAKWHGTWWARFMRWFRIKWHGWIGRLPKRVLLRLARYRPALIVALDSLAAAMEPAIETQVCSIPDFDTLVERIIFQAADLRRRGQIPKCVVLGPETNCQLMDEMVEGMRNDPYLYMGVSGDMARAFLRTSPAAIVGLAVQVSPFMAPGAVVVVGESE